MENSSLPQKTVPSGSHLGCSDVRSLPAPLTVQSPCPESSPIPGASSGLQLTSSPPLFPSLVLIRLRENGSVCMRMCVHRDVAMLCRQDFWCLVCWSSSERRAGRQIGPRGSLAQSRTSACRPSRDSTNHPSLGSYIIAPATPIPCPCLPLSNREFRRRSCWTTTSCTSKQAPLTLA